MFPRMSKDLALCIPAVAPGDPRDLSVGQQELLNAVQVTSHVPEIIALSRLSEGIALRELEGLLRGGWVIPLNPTLGGRHAIDALPVSGGMTPSTVKGFVSPDELSAAHTQRTFNPASTSRSEQEMEAALARLTDMTIKPGDTASVFASSVAPQTPQVNAAQTSAPEPAPARPPEARTSIKAVPIRTVAVGTQKPREPQAPAQQTSAPIAPAQQTSAPIARAQVVTPKVPDAKRSTQPVLDPAQVNPAQPAWLSATEKDQSARRSSNPPPRSDNPGEWRSPIPLPSDLASDRRSPLPRVTGDRRSPLPGVNATGDRSSAPPGLGATADRRSPLPLTSKADRPSSQPPASAASTSVRAEVVADAEKSNAARVGNESNDNFVFMLGPKSAPPLSPFPPAPSGEFSSDEHELEGLYAPQERTVSDIESLRKGSSRPPPNVSEVQSLNLDAQAQAAGEPPAVGGHPGNVARPAPRSLSSDKWPREELVPGEPLPLVRVTRRSSPALGTRIPDRVVTVGQRDGGGRNRGAQSPVPVAPVPIVNAAHPRLGGGTLVGGMGGMQARRESISEPELKAPAEQADVGVSAGPAVGAETSRSSESSGQRSGDSSSDAPRAPLNRESGRTLLGGSYASAIAAATSGSGQSPAQTEPALPAQRTIGMSRMVVVGEWSQAAQASPAGSPPAALQHPHQQQTAAQTPLIPAATPAGVTLLGVPAPDVGDDAALLANYPANDTPEPESAADADQLDHFEVIECLARGGSGVVYRVRDPRAATGEYLALKVLRQGVHRNVDAVDALAREATLMGLMQHPSLVQLHDFGHEGDEPFLLMECVNGLSMSQLLHHPVPLPLDVGLIIIQDTLEVLDYVHRQTVPNEAPGIVHCDVSPQNLLVGRDGRTRLIDFGISRTPGSPIGESVVRCKPRYASPELLAGASVDTTTDIFAVGAVLFQVLSKTPAFSSDPERRKRESLVPNPSKLNSRAPSRFDPICHRALAHDPRDRFQTAREMLDEINRAVELSSIELRRERVQNWVQNVLQARQGEVMELSGDQLKEMLSDGRRTGKSSGELSSAHTSDPPSRPGHISDIPVRAAAATQEMPAVNVDGKRPRSRPRASDTVAAVVPESEDELSPKAKSVIAGVAVACIVILVGMATLAPGRFGGLFHAERTNHLQRGETLPTAMPLPSAVSAEPPSALPPSDVAQPSAPAAPAKPELQLSAPVDVGAPSESNKPSSSAVAPNGVSAPAPQLQEPPSEKPAPEKPTSEKPASQKPVPPTKAATPGSPEALAPKAEAPKAQTPKAETPQAETPKAAAPAPSAVANPAPLGPPAPPSPEPSPNAP